MLYKYSPPQVDIHHWFVTKENLEKIYQILDKRFPREKIRFDLQTKSGNNRSYDSFDEFERDISVINNDKEEVEYIRIEAAVGDSESKIFKMAEIFLSFKFNKAYFRVHGEDQNQEAKDWVVGTQQNFKELKEIFETTFPIRDKKESTGDFIIFDPMGIAKASKLNELVPQNQLNNSNNKESGLRLSEVFASLKFFTYIKNKIKSNPMVGIFLVIVFIVLAIVFVVIPAINDSAAFINNFVLNNKSQSLNDNENKKVLNSSIFDLVSEIDKLSTSAERKEKFNNYIGLTAKDAGFVDNIIKYDRSSLDSEHYGIWLKNEIQASSSVNCVFDSSWNQKILSLKVNDKINFKGVIVDNTLLLTLDNCSIN